MSPTERQASDDASDNASEQGRKKQGPEKTIAREELRGGQMWSRVLRRGQRLRLTDLEGGASVAILPSSVASRRESISTRDDKYRPKLANIGPSVWSASHCAIPTMSSVFIFACYLALILYFKSKGGYKPVQLATDKKE